MLRTKRTKPQTETMTHDIPAAEPAAEAAPVAPTRRQQLEQKRSALKADYERLRDLVHEREKSVGELAARLDAMRTDPAVDLAALAQTTSEHLALVALVPVTLSARDEAHRAWRAMDEQVLELVDRPIQRARNRVAAIERELPAMRHGVADHQARATHIERAIERLLGEAQLLQRQIEELG